MTKQVITGVLMGLLMTVMGAPQAWAAADATNNTDSLIIRITPNVDLGVEIDTAAYDSGGDGYISLGTVDMYTTTFTVRPATVTFVGNVGNNGSNTGQELDVSGSITGGWTFDLTPSVTPTSGEIDALAMYLLFSDTALSAVPTAADFTAGAGGFTGPTLRAGGDSATTGVKYEHVGNGSVDMDNKSANDSMHLWFFFRLPNQSSTGNAQDVEVILSAVNAST